MIHLRAARSTDAGKVGAILSEFAQGADWMPKLHTGAEDVAHAGVMIERGWVSIATFNDRVAGFAACNGGVLDALYVASDAQGKGLGTALLQQLQENFPALALWTFQANGRAQDFYVKHGFVEQERTDGAGNDEGLPDVRFEWRKEGK